MYICALLTHTKSFRFEQVFPYYRKNFITPFLANAGKIHNFHGTTKLFWLEQGQFETGFTEYKYMYMYVDAHFMEQVKLILYSVHVYCQIIVFIKNIQIVIVPIRMYIIKILQAGHKKLVANL